MSLLFSPNANPVGSLCGGFRMMKFARADRAGIRTSENAATESGDGFSRSVASFRNPSVIWMQKPDKEDQP
jgi:hypothetical protein